MYTPRARCPPCVQAEAALAAELGAVRAHGGTLAAQRARLDAHLLRLHAADSILAANVADKRAGEAVRP